jgi:hypothetical protein
MRLALAAGKQPDELAASITSKQFSEWMAFDRIEPIGEERIERMLALVCAVIANCHRTKGRKWQVKDFLPDYQREPGERMTVEQSADFLKSLCVAMGGTINGGNRDVSGKSSR